MDSVSIDTIKDIVLPCISYVVIIFDGVLFVCTSLSLIQLHPLEFMRTHSIKVQAAPEL